MRGHVGSVLLFSWICLRAVAALCVTLLLHYSLFCSRLRSESVYTATLHGTHTNWSKLCHW